MRNAAAAAKSQALLVLDRQVLPSSFVEAQNPAGALQVPLSQSDLATGGGTKPIPA